MPLTRSMTPGCGIRRPQAGVCGLMSVAGALLDYSVTSLCAGQQMKGGVMEIHLGRVVDHIQLGVRDLERSKAFYRAVLTALGRDLTSEHSDHFASDELIVAKAEGETSNVHLAFQAGDEEQVRRFHAAALSAGGTNNGAPGERSYHRGYFAAFVLDPDGNNLEAVFHGAGRRTAPSVVVTPETPV